MLEGMIGESISIPRVQLAGLRIGLLRHPGADKFLQQDIQAFFDHVVEILQKAGAQVQPIELAGLELARDALIAIIEPEASLIHRDLLRDQPTGFADITRAQLEAGSAVTAISASPLTASSNTRAFYHFHIDDPITFDESPVLDWQAGDTPQISWTGGTPKNWINADYYTES